MLNVWQFTWRSKYVLYRRQRHLFPVVYHKSAVGYMELGQMTAWAKVFWNRRSKQKGTYVGALLHSNQYKNCDRLILRAETCRGFVCLQRSCRSVARIHRRTRGHTHTHTHTHTYAKETRQKQTLILFLSLHWYLYFT
jgi:hypothetical protein